MKLWYATTQEIYLSLNTKQRTGVNYQCYFNYEKNKKNKILGKKFSQIYKDRRLYSGYVDT